MSAGEQLGLKQDAPATQGPVVEQRHVEVVPENERHGRPRDQFTLWFAANANVVNFTLGVLAILFGLNLLWALVAIVVGNVLGMLLTALHAWQGPRLGVHLLRDHPGGAGTVPRPDLLHRTVRQAGRADISWIVGFAVASLLYLAGLGASAGSGRVCRRPLVRLRRVI